MRIDQCQVLQVRILFSIEDMNLLTYIKGRTKDILCLSKRYHMCLSCIKYITHIYESYIQFNIHVYHCIPRIPKADIIEYNLMYMHDIALAEI